MFIIHVSLVFIVLTDGCMQLQRVGEQKGYFRYLHEGSDYSDNVVSFDERTSLAVLRKDNRYGKFSRTWLEILILTADIILIN